RRRSSFSCSRRARLACRTPCACVVFAAATFSPSLGFIFRNQNRPRFDQFVTTLGFVCGVASWSIHEVRNSVTQYNGRILSCQRFVLTGGWLRTCPKRRRSGLHWKVNRIGLARRKMTDNQASRRPTSQE